MFSKTYPKIELITHTGSFAEINKLFHDRAVDLALLLTLGDVAGWRTELIGRCRLAFLASPKHELATERAISPEVLGAHSFVSPRRDSYFGRTVDSILAQAGIKNVKVAAQMHESDLVRQMVIAGVGISCALRRSVARDIAAGNIVELDVDVPPMYLELRLARHGRVPEIDKFVRVIRKVEFEDENAELPVSMADDRQRSNGL